MSDDHVQAGKLVEITYRILNENGEVMEQIDLPVGYIHGSESGLILKVEAALAGKKAGDYVEVELSPEEAFGPHDPALTFTDDLDNVPAEFRQIGAEVEMRNDRGEARKFVVSKIEDGKLTVDGNHPMAGMKVKFLVTVATVREPTAEDLATDGRRLN